MRDTYKTKQKEAIVSYISSRNGEHVTVSEISEYFKNSNAPIGATTIYRHLEKLVQEGQMKKYHLGKAEGTCYQYVSQDGYEDHYHFKCASCGQMLHIRCSALDHVRDHVFTEHKFQTDIANTIFMGICEGCQTQ